MRAAKFDLSEARTSVDPDRGLHEGEWSRLSAADGGDVGGFQKKFKNVDSSDIIDDRSTIITKLNL
jgi:hypothetical protein